MTPGAETCDMRMGEKCKLNVMESKLLRTVSCMRRLERPWKEEMKRITAVREKVSEGVDGKF